MDNEKEKDTHRNTEGAAMEAMQIYNRQEVITGAAAPAMQFSGSYFADFVAWIDRSEKTTRSYLTNLKQFMAWLKFAAILNPVRADIIAYKEWLSVEHDAISIDTGNAAGWRYRTDNTGNPLKVKCKPNTVAQYLRIVCQFFRWTAASNLYPDIASNIHAPKIKNNTHRKEALTPDEVLTIETSIAQRAAERTQAAQEMQKDTAGRMQRSTEQGKRLYAMYLLAVNAGLRTIEISRANVKDLVTKNGQTTLYIWGKGCTEPDQKKPLAPEVAAAIREYLNSRTDRPNGTSPLFVSTGNRSGGKRIAPTTISTMLKQAMKEAGFDSERITAHSLRHTAGNNVRKITGNNIYETQKYMRHNDPKTTEIYMHDGEEEEAQQAEIAQRLYNHYHGNTGANDPRAQLETIIARMNPQQLEQLHSIAAAIA